MTETPNTTPDPEPVPDEPDSTAQPPEQPPAPSKDMTWDAEHEKWTEISEEAARAREHMQQLRPEERQVLELSINHGLSQSQIAETTNLPLGTVKTHTRRGLIRLRELLGVNLAGGVAGGGR